MFAARPGFLSLLKDGGRHFSGLEEATFRNIDACKKLCEIIRTSLGPNRMNKIIINNIEKVFVTSDAATIIEQLEVQHPAAKLLAMASKMQEQEFGDGTNFVATFAGELLRQAEILLKQGLHGADITKGYEAALEKAIVFLEEAVCYRVVQLNSSEELKNAVLTSVASKALGSEELMARLIAEAAVAIMPSNPAQFNVDNIRVAKLIGGGLKHQSQVIHGMVVTRDVSGAVAQKRNCKVLVLGSGLEMSSTETKGTVLINNAEQLMNFSKGEEEKMEENIKAIADSGVEAIIVGGVISDLAQHYCNKYNILTLKCKSKFELRRLCRTLGAVALIRLGAPTPEEMGYAESICVEEIASKKVTVIKAKDSQVATILLRGATANVLDELECTVDDGVHCIKNLIKDNRFVAGGAACEIELAHKLQAYGATVAGLEQYAIIKFGEALECVARTLADNAGLHSTHVITQLYNTHKQGKRTMGVDVLAEEADSTGVTDMLQGRDSPIIDHYKTKECALKLASDAAITVLRVDQIIMSRPAGGPKPPQQSGNWDQD